MKQNRQGFLSKISVSTVLLLHGWRPCKLADGSSGWLKVESKTSTRKGPMKYAIAHVLS